MQRTVAPSGLRSPSRHFWTPLILIGFFLRLGVNLLLARTSPRWSRPDRLVRRGVVLRPIQTRPHPSPQRQQGNAARLTALGRGFPRSRVGLAWEWAGHRPHPSPQRKQGNFASFGGRGRCPLPSLPSVQWGLNRFFLFEVTALTVNFVASEKLTEPFRLSCVKIPSWRRTGDLGF